MKKPTVIDWVKEFSVKNESLDDDHKYLLSLVNEMHRNDVQDNRKRVEQLLSSLIAYAIRHFYREESHMIQVGYRDIERHRAEHEVFLVRIAEFHERLRKGDAAQVGGAVVRFLADWWKTHILREDLRYVPQVAATPAAPSVDRSIRGAR